MSAKTASGQASKGLITSPPAGTQVAAQTPCVVGIGASAGSFEALRSFFHLMPTDSGVAFVIIEHMDPAHTRLAPHLFAKCTRMPVSEATENERIEANHVYTSPSGKEVSVRQGRLVLTPRQSPAHLRLPMDHFFHSLGEDRGARAIAIVLSGTGTDGILGLKTIALHGGIVLVQQPSSTVTAGVANLVLPIEEMPRVICHYARHPYLDRPASDNSAANDAKGFHTILKVLAARRGNDFSGYKPETLQRKILRRMGLHGMLEQSAYVNLLQTCPAEVDALSQDVQIGVVQFFLDPLAWATLDSDVITPLVAARKTDEPIRIWIPGCATGEEAYSMAMTVLDRVRKARKHCPVQIFATDTNREALSVGRLGHYPAGIAAHMPAAMLRRYFLQDTDRRYFAVNPLLRGSVVFGVQNLFADPPFARVDLISCQNVLRYLEPDLQNRVLDIFHSALRNEGHLFLGSTESYSGRDDLFRPLSKQWRLFRRAGLVRSELLPTRLRMGDARSGNTLTAAQGPVSPSLVAGIAQKLILDRFSPASVLVGQDNHVLYFCGPTDEFLSQPRGVPTLDLLAMVRQGLRTRLRAALKAAAEADLSVTASGARMKRDGDFLPVQFTVTPAPGGDLGRLFLVVFRHELAPVLAVPAQGPQATLLKHLEEELQATRDELQIVLERFESGNQSLRVANEEVVITHAALDSLNEEIESSKEELLSLNDELSTANQALASKVREREAANHELENLLKSSDIATIYLDPALCIKWFTPAAQAQFKLVAGDIGRPLKTFALFWDEVGLMEAAQQVLASRSLLLHELKSDGGQRFIRRLLPCLDERKNFSGVILTYTDITNLPTATNAYDEAAKELVESRAAHAKLRTLAAALAVAEERERRALAQDLHDDFGQIMAVLGLKTAEMKKLALPDRLKAAVEQCARIVDQANRKLRTMAFQLSPPILQDMGMAAALRWIADEMNHVYNLQVHTTDDGTPKPLDPAVAATLFRAVRELLINVAKHANVESAKVHAEVQSIKTKSPDGGAGTLVVTVSDDGNGFDPQIALPINGAGGFGLISVRERLALLGGEFLIRSNPGDGTSVVLKVPLLGQAPGTPSTSGA